VFGYEVIYQFQPAHIPYPAQALSESGKEPEGRSFHHGRFVQKLRGAAMRSPNVTVVESTAVDVVKNEWTGQILGMECKTNGEKDFVCALPARPPFGVY
jgi:squalene monooxygenase